MLSAGRIVAYRREFAGAQDHFITATLHHFTALKRQRVNTLILHRGDALIRESKFSELSENSDRKKIRGELSENFRCRLRLNAPGKG